MNIKKINKQIKGVFKQPEKKYYFGRLKYGSPYFYTRNSIKIVNLDLGWKDKWDSPRVEWQPSFQIIFFGLQFCIWWNAPKLENGKIDNDTYYEMILWWLKYSNKDIEKAKRTWGWVDGETKKSTWVDSYIEKN